MEEEGIEKRKEREEGGDDPSTVRKLEEFKRSLVG